MNFIEKLNTLENVDDIKELLKARYLKNIAFFEKKNPQYAIKLKQKPAEYGLVVDDGGVNIMDINTNSFVYPQVNGRHTMMETSITIAKNPMTHTKWKAGFGHNPYYMLSTKLQITGEACKSAFYFAVNKTNGELELKALDSALPSAFLYGLGGGIILEVMRCEYQHIDSFFIYEPINDFFGISAYFVDYEALFKSLANIFFAVGEIPDTNEIKNFFGNSRIVTLFPRLEMSLFDTPEITQLKELVSLEADTAFRGFGSYEDEMIGWRNSHLNTGFNDTLQYPALIANKKKIDAVICVVANGASLDSLIPFLIENQDNMVIFSAGTTLRSLIKNGIKPDFQIEIERIDYLAGILIEAGIDDIDIIAANVVDPKTIKTTKGDKFIFYRDYTSSATLNAPKAMVENASPLVGNAALALALRLSHNVIICGMDVGYKSGATHSKDSIYDKDRELPGDSVAVVANFAESEIYSNSFYNLSKSSAEKAIANHKGANVLNMSDGAYIEGAEPARGYIFRKKINKKIVISKIKSFFSAKRTEVFAKKGMDAIWDEIEFFKTDITSCLIKKTSSKIELFARIRELETKLDIHEAVNKTVYLLFGSSMRHIIFSIYTAALHCEDEEIEKFYDFAAIEAHKTLMKMLADFKSSNSKLVVSNLLSNIKQI